MLPVELWVITLVVVVVALSALAQRLSLPYPTLNRLVHELDLEESRLHRGGT